VKLASPQVQEVVRGLQALRGIAEISAVTIVAELGQIARFENARQLMGYSGAVPRENSSGQRQQRGGITKTGNAHLRRIAIELPGATGSNRPSVQAYASGRKMCRNPSKRLPGRRSFVCTSVMPGWPLRARSAQDRYRRGSRTAGFHLGHRREGGNRSQTIHRAMTSKRQSKSKTFPTREKTKTHQPMNNVNQTQGQGQPQPERARRRILDCSMRQAQPDSRY